MFPRYWIGVVSLSHVERGIAGGFAQVCHGKAAPLRRMSAGDGFIYYSPKTDMLHGSSLQQFTAIGHVIGDETYEYAMSDSFVPFRRDIRYLNATCADIKPLIGELSFIKDKTYWGYPFRAGHFEISRDDFEKIAQAMKVNRSDDAY